MSCTDLKTVETKEQVLSVIDIPNNDYKLKVVFQPSNATIQSAIQVRKINKDNKESVLETYERYNVLDTYKLINNTTFMMVVRDTISYFGNHPDTLYVKLK